MAPTRWAIVSCGRISTDFVQAVKLLPTDDHQIVAVAARNIKSAQEFADKFGIPKAYGSYEELAKERSYDVVYIGSIHPMHFPLMKLFIGQGHPILCEKPITMNVRELMEIIQLAREKQVFLMEGFWSRCFPIYEDLRSELKNSTIGEVRFVSVNFGGNHWKNIQKVSKKQVGGGSLLDIGCYTVQFAQLVYNHERPKKITASGILDPESGLDLTVSITLEYSNDRVAVLSMSGICAMDQRATVFGDRQTNKDNVITLDNFWCPSTMVTPNKTYNHPYPEAGHCQFNFPNSEGLSYQAQSVRECLQKGLKENPLITLDQSLQIQEIMDTVRSQLGIVYDSDHKAWQL